MRKYIIDDEEVSEETFYSSLDECVNDPCYEPFEEAYYPEEVEL